MNIEARLIPGMNVSQELNLAPQLLQWLKLLQLPSVELSALVSQELETNPALELDVYESAPDGAEDFCDEIGNEHDFMSEPTTFDDEHIGEKFEMLAQCDSDWANDDGFQQKAGSNDDSSRHDFMMSCIKNEESLVEHLLSQLVVSGVNKDERGIAEVIIGCLDTRGYLSVSLDELAETAGASLEKVKKVLDKIQSMDPAGVAARDLKECLLLQLSDKQGLAAVIVRDFLENLGAGQHQAIAEALDVTEDDVMDAWEEIRALNPEPGSVFGRENVEYVSPDVVLERRDDDFEVVLNDQRIPALRLSAACRNMMSNGKLSDEDAAYLRKKVRNASFIIQGIKQRQDTLKKVSTEILNHQRDYLSSEDGMLKPLTMAKVAARIGVHETTVSRALANKYIQTPRGVKEMRFFFRSGYKCADGSSIVPSGVKDMITEMVEKENKLCPLTDLHIVERMKKKGITLARRTVAKYREELGIPSSKERHSYEKEKASVKIRVVHNAKPESAKPLPAERRTEKIYA